MKNPLFLILIVRKNRNYFNESGSQNLFNEHENTNMKGSNTEANNAENLKSVSKPDNGPHSEMDKQKGN
jgi:hypothetical protein